MVRLFYHLIDMATVNAYILYRRATVERWNDASNESSETKLLQLPEFREKIAAGLVSQTERRVGRPSSRPSTPVTPPPPAFETCTVKPGRKAIHPVEDVRFDCISHNPIMLTNKEKRDCKHCKKSKTQFFCEKCRLHLCITQAKNCFNEYHRRA